VTSADADEPHDPPTRADGAAGPSLLLVGWVAGAHGIRGRLKVKLADARSTSLRAGIVLQLGADGGRRAVAEASEPDARGVLRVALEGLRTREAAEPLRGTALYVDRAQLPALAADEYYLADTIGAEVFDEQGRGLGRVLGITSNGAQALLEVAWPDETGAAHEWLLPALPGFVLGVAEGRVTASVPDGFLPDALTGGGDDDEHERRESDGDVSDASDDLTEAG
jgi:16S rRNA processing protein RimM